MKRYLFALLFAACAIACGGDDPVSPSDGEDEGPTPPADREQQVVCGIMELSLIHI